VRERERERMTSKQGKEETGCCCYKAVKPKIHQKPKILFLCFKFVLTACVRVDGLVGSQKGWQSPKPQGEKKKGNKNGKQKREVQAKKRHTDTREQDWRVED
jgi:hypothetical protein